ncbi:PLP-dependent aminotransferase family protein [Saccharopolyspora erythraea]|uniref:MocR-like transcription factor YczR n=1 Tax=Saccharopolyspora erythraea TaxID=1836 RepID=UPI001BA5CADB|nr:PLP-dependent aminotransferase family protein [Saccharopolyspora erythraea]QUH05340.1 PLP-dependent aminotransferase family protein [Saccharopolyspora erythraea]
MVYPSASHITGRKLAELLGSWSADQRRSSQSLFQYVKQLVLDGRLPPGTRLPAERDLAETLGVSRTLVARTLERLRESGFAESRRGAGSWVTLPGGKCSPTPHGGWYPSASGNEIIDLAQATPTAPPEVAEAIDRARLRLVEEITGHGYHPQGHPVLRERIAERYRRRGLPTRPEQILVTNGAQHAFALVLRMLVAPGERVLVEHPTYPNSLEAIRGANASPVAVPMVPGGWDLELLEATLRQAAPRLAYLIPDFQNPTGALMGEADRSGLVAMLRRSHTTAVIDETLVEVDLTGSAPPPPVASFAERNVITVGSASKAFWGGLRLGWLRAPEDVVQRMVVGRAQLDLGCPVLEQLMLAELLADSEEILRRRREEWAARRDCLAAALGEQLPDWSFRVPDGGLSLWCDTGAPMGSRLVMAAAEHGVRLAPGSRFAVNGSQESRVRLPYALPEEHLVEAVRRLAKAVSARGEVAAAPAPEPQVT